MTGIGNLDALTLTNWSDVLPARGLAPRRAHWCPKCLQEDLEGGGTPYFRLAWEVGPVQACYRHKSRLTDVCPHCGQRHVRHHSGILVPGWCNRCGGFLGEGELEATEPRELWIARQVEDWISNQSKPLPMPDANTVLHTLNILILGLDGGQYARFAKRLGLTKSAVHNWLRNGGLPGLNAYLAMAGHSGLRLEQVMRGDLNDWEPPHRAGQLAMDFEFSLSEARPAPRQHDWPAFRHELEKFLKLPEPISVAEASRRLGVDDRLLYLRANDLARALGERWKDYLAERKATHQEQAKSYLREALPKIVGNGRPFNFAEVRQTVPPPVLSSAEGMFGLIREVREQMM